MTARDHQYRVAVGGRRCGHPHADAQSRQSQRAWKSPHLDARQRRAVGERRLGTGDAVERREGQLREAVRERREVRRRVVLALIFDARCRRAHEVAVGTADPGAPMKNAALPGPPSRMIVAWGGNSRCFMRCWSSRHSASVSPAKSGSVWRKGSDVGAGVRTESMADYRRRSGLSVVTLEPGERHAMIS